MMRKMSTDEFNHALGHKLRELREEAELTQLQMALRLKVHPNTVANYERGQGMMMVVFIKACNVLKYQPSIVLAELMR